MTSLGKYLIGMAAGAALAAGGGLAYSAAGTAKYEPCRITQPAPGVTQLCQDAAAAAAANARGGAIGVGGANGGGVSSGGGSTVVGGGLTALDSGTEDSLISVAGITLPQASLPGASELVSAIPGGVTLPSGSSRRHSA